MEGAMESIKESMLL